jgi:hypothetical protein
MSRDNSFDIAYYLIGGGAIIYYGSLLKHKLRRRMRDIPRSKIGSTAIGSNVEIQGRVLNMAGDGVVAPLSGTRGAAFIWKLEQQDGIASDNWEHLYTYHSAPYLYIHDDEEFTAAIDLSACEFQEDIFSRKVEFTDRTFVLPEEVKGLLNKTRMLDTSSKTSFLSEQRFRLSERVFEYNQPIYVLGAAKTSPKEEISMNQNRNLLFGSREIGSSNDYLNKAKILFTNDESASGAFKLEKVYLSTKSEADLSSGLRRKGLLGLVGGPIMIAAGVFYLVLKFSK